MNVFASVYLDVSHSKNQVLNFLLGEVRSTFFWFGQGCIYNYFVTHGCVNKMFTAVCYKAYLRIHILSGHVWKWISLENIHSTNGQTLQTFACTEDILELTSKVKQPVK